MSLVWNAALAALAVGILTGCTRAYRWEDFRAGYRQAEMPAPFAGDGARLRLSGYAAYSGQKEVDLRGDSSYETGSGMDGYESHPYSYRYRVSRDAATLGGTALYMGNGRFVGIGAGLAAPNPDHWHFGLVGGLTRKFGRVTPMAAVGAYYTRVEIDASHILLSKPIIEGGISASRGTIRREIQDLSWPLKAGLMFEAGLVSPYVVVGRNATRVWPLVVFGSSEDADPPTMYAMEAAMGIRMPAARGVSVLLEAGFENVRFAELWDRSHPNARLRVELDRF